MKSRKWSTQFVKALFIWKDSVYLSHLANDFRWFEISLGKYKSRMDKE